MIDFNDGVYLADLGTLLGVLAHCPQDMNNILVIGHNPGLEELLEYLCGEDLPLSAKGKLMPTATLAQIALPDDWRGLAARSGKMVHIVRPDELT